MNIDKQTGLLQQAEYIVSPNFDQRPDENDISLIVLHNISLPPKKFGTGDVVRLFTNRLDINAHPYYQNLQGLKVSSHLLIERNGNIIQFVPFHLRAWHAGESDYCGRKRCNDFAIGIELEGSDEIAYENVQYQQLFAIIPALVATYSSLSFDRIVGHQDIAPERKTDPGPAFDWALLRQTLPSDMS